LPFRRGRDARATAAGTAALQERCRINTHVSCALGWIDCRSAAGGWILGFRPGFALLWRATDSQPGGSRSGTAVALLVVAGGRRAAPKSGYHVARGFAGGGPALADHCASCHGNKGDGNTEIGQNLYPPAPDMRLPATQQLSDGELYYIIHNGVRWTGMPAWGEPGNDNDQDSWKLVIFIRHLPSLTADELHGMERFNPKSDADREEEKEEQEFLNGGPSGDQAPKSR